MLCRVFSGQLLTHPLTSCSLHLPCASSLPSIHPSIHPTRSLSVMSLTELLDSPLGKCSSVVLTPQSVPGEKSAPAHDFTSCILRPKAELLPSCSHLSVKSC